MVGPVAVAVARAGEGESALAALPADVQLSLVQMAAQKMAVYRCGRVGTREGRRGG